MDVLFFMEVIGTIAFSCSGAMLAIQKRLDLLGVIVLGVITAVGGGMIRDIMIGVHPPTLFVNPVYVSIAVASAIATFSIMMSSTFAHIMLEVDVFDWLMNLMDAIGLGAFTVVGVNAALRNGYENYLFLTIFLGVITGVGGGLLRDMMVGMVPSVLRKHIYACASIVGAVFYVLISPYFDDAINLILSALIVTIIRVLARKYKWNLPKIQ